MSDLRPIPQVQGLPILGNLRDFDVPNLRKFLTDCYLEHGPVFQVSVLGIPISVIAGPKANQFMIKEGHKYFRSEQTFRPYDHVSGSRHSIFSLDGELHRKVRKIEGRIYARSYFFRHFHKALRVAAEELAALQEGQSFAVTDWCKRVIIEQIAQVATNSTVKPYINDLVTFIQTNLMVAVTRQRPRLMLWTPHYLGAKKRALEMTDALMETHLQNPPEQTGREPDLIDDVLSAQKEEPDFWEHGDARMACMTAFSAGMDTAANSLAFVLYRLHEHPEYLPDILQEVDAFFADGRPDPKGLAKLKHLHHFLMEVLRVDTISPAMTRYLVQDLEFEGVRIPDKSRVLIATSVTHGIEECFTQPEQFDPSRFERGEHRKAGTYTPFGLGAHSCAGSGMAESLITLNTAALLYTYELQKTDPDYRLQHVARPTPAPNDHFRLTVRRRRRPAVQLLA